jgi:hypothetical protein
LKQAKSGTGMVKKASLWRSAVDGIEMFSLFRRFLIDIKALPTAKS